MAGAGGPGLVAPSLDELDAELCRRSLRRFIIEAWPIVEPGTPYVPNWHIDAICEHLEAVTAGEIKRLLINIPPRHMKSLAVSVFWPVWVWLTQPEKRWLFASYAERLSKRDSLKCRRIIQSEGLNLPPEEMLGRSLFERIGYQGVLRLLGNEWALTGDQNEKLRFENDRTGYRIASSVGGFATGEGGDVIVCDDPHKVDEVESDVSREGVLDWWDGTMPTRLNDPKTGAKVIVMQRIHEVDLAGHEIERGRYTHLCLPARYEPSHPFVWPGDPRTTEGELLWPEHVPRPELEEIAETLGSYRAAGQLQQRPAPAEGGIFKRSWFEDDGRMYEPYRWPPADQGGIQEVCCSWDTAFKKGDGTDYVVGQVWGRDLADKYLLAQVRARMDFPETCEAVIALRDWVDEHVGLKGRIYIEDAASGRSVYDSLRRRVPGLIPVSVAGDSKESRAHAVTPQCEAGNVHLPRGSIPCPAPYKHTATDELIHELTIFNAGIHDDQVDALSQALNNMDKREGASRVRTGGYDPGRLRDV